MTTRNENMDDNGGSQVSLEMISDLLDSFSIKRISRDRYCGGRWVMGTIGGHKFEALVFAEHAECESYELDRSRISKLWLQRTSDKTTVARFDRGWDLRPATEVAQIIVESLCEGLADIAFE